MRIKIRWGRPVAAILLTLALSLTAGACGGSTTDNSKVTIVVGAQSTAEGQVLGRIYAQALEAAGYDVRRNFGLELLAPQEELELEFFSGYPEHVGTALTSLLGVEFEAAPADPMQAYEKAKAGFEEEGLTAFPPAPFALTNTVGMLRKTGEERGLETMSDLEGKSEEMTLMGPSTCHTSLDCLGGLEAKGIAFKGFIGIDPALRYKVLEDREIDSSIVPTTDGRLATDEDEFVALEEDAGFFPAGNAIWVTTVKAVEEAGPDYEKAIVDAQKGLTLKVMRELNAQVELEKKPADEVAAAYLKSLDSPD